MIRFILSICSILFFAGYAKADEPTIISCKFEKLPPMILIIRGGMGAEDNTLQVGQSSPVQLHVGSSLMTADYHAQEFVFSLRLPASVTVSALGNNSITYDGECISSLQP